MLDGEPLITPAGLLCLADVASVLLDVGDVLLALAIEFPDTHTDYVARLPWWRWELES